MRERSGAALGLAAYLMWGAFPLYFRLLERSGPFEIVAHRALWSLVFCGAALTVLGRWGQVRAVTPRVVGALAAAGRHQAPSRAAAPNGEKEISHADQGDCRH